MLIMSLLPVFFYFLFFIDSKHWLKTTQILVFLNIHFRILTWNMGYLLCLYPIFACWPQIVNFISPNSRSSVFVQIKFIGSLPVWLPWAYFLCFSVSFSLLTFFLPNFAKYALKPMSECSCLFFELNKIKGGHMMQPINCKIYSNRQVLMGHVLIPLGTNHGFLLTLAVWVGATLPSRPTWENTQVRSGRLQTFYQALMVWELVLWPTWPVV